MEKIKQIDNYVVYHEKDEQEEYYILKAVSGQWELKFRNDSTQFQIISTMLADETYNDSASIIFNMWYAVTNSLVDADFIEDIFDAIADCHERAIEAGILKDETEHHDDEGDLLVDEAEEAVNA